MRILIIDMLLDRSLHLILSDLKDLGLTVQNNVDLSEFDKATEHEFFNDITSPSPSSQLYFLDAPAGYGKTFLENVCMVQLKIRHHKVLAVASSAIAATLLNGVTAHKAFGIQVRKSPSEHHTLTNLKLNSREWNFFKDLDFLFWDEITTKNLEDICVVDRTLRKIRGVDVVFGGLVCVFSGDFRQCLPIVKHMLMLWDKQILCLKLVQLKLPLTAIYWMWLQFHLLMLLKKLMILSQPFMMISVILIHFKCH
ncbi:unnamed protein product [Ambrosiozyma monospora]|uniref:Unnamed protein product n=1 Tax=Ambrosiozyma monospora TaxID=43982 RepID=A0ACB5SR20_AMBMO|nr:unnamed protein product [Ambrosiozyma monospora]